MGGSPHFRSPRPSANANHVAGSPRCPAMRRVPRHRHGRHDRRMDTRRGLFVAPFDALADPRVFGDLAAAAEAAGWDGFFVWDHLQYGERVTDVADVWTCCAAVALRTE